MTDRPTTAPPHPGTVERHLVVLWDDQGAEAIAAVDHRFTELGIASSAVAMVRGTTVTATCTSHRLPGHDTALAARGSVDHRQPPIAVAADRVAVADDLGDGIVAGMACRWDLVPDAPPVPDAGRWAAPGLGLRQAVGTVVAVTAHDTAETAAPRHGLLRHDTGIAHLPSVAALAAPPDGLPTVAAARLAVRAADGTTTAWSLAGDDVLDAVELVAGTRWPRAVRTPDGDDLAVTCRLPMRALGPTDGWWDPERWHDELAIGLRRFDADARPTDVRQLHTVAVVHGDDGAIGTLELLLLGAFDRHGLSGFAGGWRAPGRGADTPVGTP